MSRRDEIKSAYKNLGKAHSFYDGMMTGTSFFGKIILKKVWCMTKEDALEYQAAAFEAIPKDFSGSLLEVPVGTGVLSMPVWKTLPDAEITCLDYSEKMMQSAQERADEMQIKNIRFLQGDVGKLPFEDESFDCVVSLNGFHAFPDKDAAFRETCRVLKPGGIFCGCFYIKDEFKRTDWFVKHMYVPKGFFTPPFETKESLKERLDGLYSQANVHTVNAEGIFCCVK